MGEGGTRVYFFFLGGRSGQQEGNEGEEVDTVKARGSRDILDKRNGVGRSVGILWILRFQ